MDSGLINSVANHSAVSLPTEKKMDRSVLLVNGATPWQMTKMTITYSVQTGLTYRYKKSLCYFCLTEEENGNKCALLQFTCTPFVVLQHSFLFILIHIISFSIYLCHYQSPKHLYEYKTYINANFNTCSDDCLCRLLFSIYHAMWNLAWFMHVTKLS